MMNASRKKFTTQIISAPVSAHIRSESAKTKYVTSRYDELHTLLSEYDLKLYLWLFGSHILHIRKDIELDPILPNMNPNEASTYPDLKYIKTKKVIKLLKERVNIILDLVTKDSSISRAKLIVKRNEIVEMKIGVKGQVIVSLSRSQYDKLREMNWSDENIYLLAARYGVWNKDAISPLPSLPKLQNPTYYKTLEELYGVDTHLFATPYEHYYKSNSNVVPSSGYGYIVWPPTKNGGDIFRDSDALDVIRKGGAFEANMIGLDDYHSLFIEYIKSILKTEVPITIFLLIEKGKYPEFEYNIVLSRTVELIIIQNEIGKEKYIITSQTITQIQDSFIGKVRLREAEKLKDDTLSIPPLLDNKGRMTVPILNRFEKAKLLATRAEQLADGAKPKVSVKSGTYNLIEIGEQEMQENVFPVKLLRPLPGDGNVEEWDYKELYDPFRNV